MYSVGMGIIGEDFIPVENYSAADHYKSLNEAKEAYDKLDREYLYNFLKQDLDFYETDRYFYKEIQDSDGVSLFRESYILKED